MANPRKSLLGKVFGRLTVKERAGQIKPGGNSLWLCECTCGAQTVVPYQHLTAKRTRSCGKSACRWKRPARTR